jgi:type II secretory pathway component HofQ
MLMAIIAVISFAKAPAPISKVAQDPVALFLGGTPEECRGAREALMKIGRKAVPALVAARPGCKGSSRYQALQDLIFDIKLATAAQDPADLAMLRKLQTMNMEFRFENTKVEDILSYIRAVSGLNLFLDPAVDPGIVEVFRLQDSSLRTALEVLCAVKGLDFDLRYGVCYIATPVRLWSSDSAIGLPRSNYWAQQALAPGDARVGEKLRSVNITIDMSDAPMRAVMEYLAEITGLRFKVDDTMPEGKMNIKIQDLRLLHFLELLTLPYGWDIKIEGGMVTIYDPQK